MRVRVKPTGRLSAERVVTLIDAGEGRWEVFAEDNSSPLGEVFKDHYTYSPPAAGFGGRIVRYHKRVKCWRNSGRPRRHFPTRNKALADLICWDAVLTDEARKIGTNPEYRGSHV